MAQPVEVIGPPYDEIVVDTGHLEGVQRILDDLKIEQVDFDRIKAFALVLLGSVAQTDEVNAFVGAAAAHEQITAHTVKDRIPHHPGSSRWPAMRCRGKSRRPGPCSERDDEL